MPKAESKQYTIWLDPQGSMSYRSKTSKDCITAKIRFKGLLSQDWVLQDSNNKLIARLEPKLSLDGGAFHLYDANDNETNVIKLDFGKSFLNGLVFKIEDAHNKEVARFEGKSTPAITNYKALDSVTHEIIGQFDITGGEDISALEHFLGVGSLRMALRALDGKVTLKLIVNDTKNSLAVLVMPIIIHYVSKAQRDMAQKQVR